MGAAREQCPEISATSAPKPENSAVSLIPGKGFVQSTQAWAGWTALRAGYRSTKLSWGAEGDEAALSRCWHGQDVRRSDAACASILLPGTNSGMPAF